MRYMITGVLRRADEDAIRRGFAVFGKVGLPDGTTEAYVAADYRHIFVSVGTDDVGSLQRWCTTFSPFVDDFEVIPVLSTAEFAEYVASGMASWD